MVIIATRRERVVLELQDNFTTGMAKAAAATALLDRELKSLSGQAVRSSGATRNADRDVDKLGATSRKASKEVDQLSGRLRILRDIAITTAPTLAPIGSVGIAALSGLSAQLGFAAVGAGTAVLAFQGVGDALKAVNKAAIEPTEANLDAAKVAMAGLSKESREFVRELRKLEPALLILRQTAAAGILPGITDGLDALESTFPRVQRIIATVSDELGNIARETGESFASDRWSPFLDFLATEAPSALGDMATAIGNTTHALTELWMAFTPLNRGFADWLVGATASLDRWAAGLSETQGFQEFVAYIEKNGPQVAETFGAIANAVLQIVEATAPLGGPVLAGLEAASKAIAAIADSDLGTPIFGAIAALTIYNRLLQGTTRLSKTAFGQSLKTLGGAAGNQARGATLLKGGAVAGGLALSMSGVADSMGLANTTSMALAGTLAGPWGAAIGGAIGLAMDLSDNTDNAAESQKKFQYALENFEASVGPSPTARIAAYADEIERLNGLNLKGGAGLARDTLVKSLADRQGDLRHEVDLTAIANKQAASASAVNTRALQAQAQALQAAREAARSSGAQFLEFGDNLDDSKVSLDKWIQSQRDQAAALGNAGKNAETGLSRGLDPGLIKKLMDEGPAGALRLQELAKGTQAQIDAASAGYVKGQNALRKWESAAGKVEKKVQGVGRAAQVATAKRYMLNIGANVDPAQAALNRLISQLRGLRINIPVTASTNATLADAVVNRADGGTIPGPRYPYRDKILMLGAPGEEVITNRNGEADRFRADRAAGRIPGYASGGTVGSKSYARDTLGVAAPYSVRQWHKALDASTAALKRETSQRDDLISKRDELSSTLASAFRSDLFNQDSSNSVWMSAQDRQRRGVGDVFSTLTSDIGNAKAFRAALTAARAKGLKGGAFEALAASGDLGAAQAFASGSAADVKRYQALYDQRQAVTGSLGAYAGAAVYGQQIAVSKAAVTEARKHTTELRRANEYAKRNPKATADQLARAVRGVGPRRPRKGN